MRVSIKSLILEAKQKLLSSGIDTDNFELRLLLSEVLHIDVKNLPIDLVDITSAQMDKFKFMIAERQQHKPVDKILGHKGFYKYDFVVNTSVLSPRSDTEVLLEQSLTIAKEQNYRNILELGVGSGCIITSLLSELDYMQGYGVDISASALEITEVNANKLGVSNRLKLYNSDWFSSQFLDIFDNKFDMIISNPPYISNSEIPTLDKEVREYDPILALAGGEDGLDSYRRIAELSPALLQDYGMIFLELGEGQAQDVISIFTSQGLKHYQTYKDLSGIQRCVSFKK